MNKNKIFTYLSEQKKVLKRIINRKCDINLSNKKIIKALQVTDIHLDLNYKEGTIINCGTPLCCLDYPNNTKLHLYKKKRKN